MKSSGQKTIYLMVEPNYTSTVWYSRSIEGLKNIAAKQKCNTVQVDSVDEIPEGTVSLVVMGTNKDWISSTIGFARKRKLKVILQGAVPSKYGEDVSGTMYGNRSAIEELVYYFYYHGRHKLALVGINPDSSNDVTKYETFLTTAKALGLDTSFKDVYYRSANSPNPSESFLSHIDSYDGVICGNDYIAAYILNFAEENGIQIPDRLFIAGLGDSMLCKFTSPTLTSTNRSYRQSGEQVFEIWKQLNNNPSIISLVTTMKSTIKPRESTGNLPVAENQFNYSDGEERKVSGELEKGSDTMQTIENCLTHCDTLDMKIIVGLFRNESNEKLAENLFIALGTINYRLKKIYTNAGVTNRSDFVNLMKKHVSIDALIRETKSGE